MALVAIAIWLAIGFVTGAVAYRMNSWAFDDEYVMLAVIALLWPLAWLFGVLELIGLAVTKLGQLLERYT
jgi:hypothetical protein